MTQNLIAIAGIASLTYGTWQFSQPLAFCVLGVVLCGVAVGITKNNQKETHK